jgi:hypothetical protein
MIKGIKTYFQRFSPISFHVLFQIFNCCIRWFIIQPFDICTHEWCAKNKCVYVVGVSAFMCTPKTQPWSKMFLSFCHPYGWYNILHVNLKPTKSNYLFATPWWIQYLICMVFLIYISFVAWMARACVRGVPIWLVAYQNSVMYVAKLQAHKWQFGKDFWIGKGTF